MRELASTKVAAHQQAVSEWLATRPVEPTTKRPQEPSPDLGEMGLGRRLFIVGIVAGVVFFLLDTSHPFVGILVFLALGVVPSLLIITAGGVEDLIYWLRYRHSAWAQYDADLETWKQQGDEKFKNVRDEGNYYHFTKNYLADNNL